MKQKSSLAGKVVTIKEGELAGKEYIVEDWWENVYGSSWRISDGNPAAMKYAMRTGFQDFKTPLDDYVLYGKIDGSGELVHITEL